MTGHIRRRGERSRELKFDVGTDPLTGRRVTKYRSFKGTRKEAETQLARLTLSITDGDYVDPSKVTLAEYLDRWERDWAAIHVGPKTRERYGELLRKHVRPHIGGARLQRLRPVNLTELYARLLRVGRGEGSGLSARTVGHVHRVVHKALVVAAEWDMIKTNPADVAKPPPVDDKEIQIYTEAEIATVLKGLRGRALYPRIALALGSGMRRGEILALRWSNISDNTGVVEVTESLEQTKLGLRLKPPKTKHGRRSIALPSWAMTALREHKRAQQELRLKLGWGRLPDDALVFANIDGTPLSPNGFTKEWSVAARALGLGKVTLHALRHTHASQLIASGLDVLTISRRLGHGSPTITLKVYGHLFADTDDRAARILEAAFASAITE